MITIEEISIKKVKTEWLALQNGIKTLSPFQEYEFNRILVKQYLFLPKGLKPRFFIFKEDGKTICIAPMCEDLKAKERTLMTLGSKPEVAIQDWLYDESITVEKLKECIQMLQAKYHHLVFRRVSKGTVLFSALKSISDPVSTHKNVLFKTPDTYSDWYGSLSKNMKQTMRTMYNRIASDNIKYELVIKKGSEISKEQYAELMSLIAKRRMKRYGYGQLLAFYIKHVNYHTIALRKMNNSLFFIIKMNDELAAFHAGYVYKDGKRFLFPHGAMNDKFAFYSPGDLLFSYLNRASRSDGSRRFYPCRNLNHRAFTSNRYGNQNEA